MHTCKRENGMKRQTGRRGKRAETDLIAQIKAMENTHAWVLSSSLRRQCCWNNTHGRARLSAESMKCLQHAARSWFHPTSDSSDSNMTDYNPHPSATVAFSLRLFLQPRKWADYDSAQIAFRYVSVWPCVLANGFLLLIKSWLIFKYNQQHSDAAPVFWAVIMDDMQKLICVWRGRFKIQNIYYHSSYAGLVTAKLILNEWSRGMSTTLGSVPYDSKRRRTRKD